MKISKLFHWLYAVIMLLPIFAIGSSCLISTFNMASKEETKVHYRYKTNEVSSNDELIVDNIYLINLHEFNHEIGLDLLFNNFSDVCYLSLTWINLPSTELYIDLDMTDIYIDDTSMPMYRTEIYFNEQVDNLAFYYGWVDNFIYVENNTLDFRCFLNGSLSYDIPFVIEGELSNLNNEFYKFVKPVTDYTLIPIDYVETYNVSAEDVFYRSIDKVVESPLFNWAYNSNLLGVPVSYIGGIFGLASNSVINVLLCYWLAFSIIWLVFDILMLVPLLVHKSIDKMRF